MRKAIALVELLASFVVIAVMSITVAALTRPLIIEIPRANRIMETNTSVNNMLTHLRNDIEAAVQLPDTFDDKHTDEKTLLIELPNRVVCYTLETDKVIKKVLTGDPNDREPDVWTVPTAKIEWCRWQKGSKTYALEVSTHIEHIWGGQMENKLANSHVYFVGISVDIVREK